MLRPPSRSAVVESLPGLGLPSARYTVPRVTNKEDVPDK